MSRLTIKSSNGIGYALDLREPQNENEARKQLMDKFKIAVNKLAEFENFMEENGFEDLQSFNMAIKFSQHMNNVGVKQFVELQAYKRAWIKLKKFVQKKIDCGTDEEFYDYDEMRCEMDELMPEVEDE